MKWTIVSSLLLDCINVFSLHKCILTIFMIFNSSYGIFTSYMVQSTTAWFHFVTISVLRYIKGNQWHTCVKLMVYRVALCGLTSR